MLLDSGCHKTTICLIKRFEVPWTFHQKFHELFTFIESYIINFLMVEEIFEILIHKEEAELVILRGEAKIVILTGEAEKVRDRGEAELCTTCDTS